MNNAKTYRIGNNPNTRKNKTKAIASSVGRVRPTDAKAKGRTRGAERQTEISSHSHVANGFLRTSFLPKLKESENIQACRKSEKMEKDFFLSLSRLAEHYSMVAMQVEHFPYPYNITLAISDMEEKLQQNVMNWEEIRLVQDSNKTFLVSEERYNTGLTLYYIPVAPLFYMLRKRKRTANLLLSVCSYLYHIVEIPYHRKENSYLYWMYEMMNDWVEEDEYTEETDVYLTEIKQAEWIGEVVEQKIFNQNNLTLFQERVQKFKARDDFDKACFIIAKEALDMYQCYPNANVFRNAKPHGESSDDEMENIVSMDRYISFYADSKGWLNESLVETVNNELQEYGIMEEPTIIKVFDGRDIAEDNLSFENRLFELLHNLIDVLNSFKK